MLIPIFLRQFSTSQMSLLRFKWRRPNGTQMFRCEEGLEPSVLHWMRLVEFAITYSMVASTPRTRRQDEMRSLFARPYACSLLVSSKISNWRLLMSNRRPSNNSFMPTLSRGPAYFRC